MEAAKFIMKGGAKLSSKSRCMPSEWQLGLLFEKVVDIMCDSQAAIKALESVETDSMLVWDTKRALNRVGKTRSIAMNWSKAQKK